MRGELLQEPVVVLYCIIVLCILNCIVLLHGGLEHGDGDGGAALVEHPRHGHVHGEDVVHRQHAHSHLVLVRGR